LRLSAQRAACFSQIKNITALSFYLFVLIINRMLALLVFKKAKGTGSASNKALKSLPSVAGTLTRGLTHFVRILALVLAPLSLKLYTTHFLVKVRPKFSAFLQRLWGFVLVFGQHRRKLENTAFQLKQLSSLAASKS